MTQISQMGAGGCAAALLALLGIGGCVVVGRVAPLPPAAAAPAVAPGIEYALGAFTFQMNDGEVEPSHFDVRLLAAGIVDAWERRGWIAGAEEVDPGAFTAAAAYGVTFSGAAHADTSFWAQLLNALTLLLVPYPVTTHYEVTVAVTPAAGGSPIIATASSSERTWVGLLLVFGAPFAERGHDQEVARIADALYEQLRLQRALTDASGS
jgi:hypothetical protein